MPLEFSTPENRSLTLMTNYWVTKSLSDSYLFVCLLFLWKGSPSAYSNTPDIYGVSLNKFILRFCLLFLLPRVFVPVV